MNQFIELLREHKDQLFSTHSHQLTPDKRQAVYAMLSCKTNTKRVAHWRCGHCDFSDAQALSCGNRHCPQCQHTTTRDWLTRQQQKLLPVRYFMVTFTLPFELRGLVKHHAKALYQLMFQVSASVMKDFGQRQKKGEIGFTSVLHTHNRKREIHPHIHMIVPCGAHDKTRNIWRAGDPEFLFNQQALAHVWRARILEEITQHDTLYLPDYRFHKMPTQWVVHCKKVGYGLPALKYLSRYLYRGVISDKDIVSTINDRVIFKYTDSETNTTKYRNLPTLKFLLLILQHVLPKGLQRVRDYGFLRGNAKATLFKIMIILCRSPNWLAPKKIPKRIAVRPCPCCQKNMSCVRVTLTI